MRQSRFSRSLLVAAAILASEAAFPAARDLPVGTTGEVIRKRAAGQPSPRWSLGLGATLVDELRRIGPDHLLVGLRKDGPGLHNQEYLLVNAADGKVLWRYQRARRQATYDLLLHHEGTLLFRIREDEAVSLVAVGMERGVEKWSQRFEGSDVEIVPVLSTSTLVVLRFNKKTVRFGGVGTEDGKPTWERTIAPEHEQHRPSPLVTGDHVWLFYDGAEKFSSQDGKTAVSRNDLDVRAAGLVPSSDGHDLFVVHADEQLLRIDPATGKTLWNASLPSETSFTDLFPYGERVYARGIRMDGGYPLVAHDAKNGKALWVYDGHEASVSNLLENDGRLHFATARSLEAIDFSTGLSAWSATVTKTGRAFPVRLRQFGDRIVYIGELVVAAYDAASGEQEYRHGMTPISEEAHLNGLDAAIPRLREEAGKIQDEAGSVSGFFAAFHSNEVTRYQNLSSKYRSMAQESYRTGDHTDWQTRSLQGRMASSTARHEANMAFINSAQDFATVFVKYFQARTVNTAVKRQEMMRRSVLVATMQAETNEYVFRPNLKYRDVDDRFVKLTVVHLPTGRRRDTYVSPSYLNFGLWNLVDFENEVVYHHGLGMDPSKYKMGEKAHRVYPYGKIRTLEGFLVAQPIRIPTPPKGSGESR